MQLGLLLGYAGGDMSETMKLVHEAESLGYDSVWSSEAWGTDAVSSAAWVLAQTKKVKVGTAIMQMQSRTPALAAMTVMSLQAMSGNRFILGLGASGPQVIEGWHGVPYGRPLERTREYIAIIRQIMAREGPLEHHGYHYQIPYTGEGSTGLAKPLKSILHADPSLKIYTASISPAGVRNAAHVADGVFPIFMNPERFDLFEDLLAEGFAKAGGGKSLADFDIMPFVLISVGDDLEKCRQVVKENLAFYIGGMGARDKNFYTDYAKRMGYEAEAARIQDLFLSRKRDEAVAAVPDQMVDEVALVGSRERIRDRLQVWKDASAKGHVRAILARKANLEAVRILAEEAL
jgi:F420-dependent oxidoreductase-like protein